MPGALFPRTRALVQDRHGVDSAAVSAARAAVVRARSRVRAGRLLFLALTALTLWRLAAGDVLGTAAFGTLGLGVAWATGRGTRRVREARAALRRVRRQVRAPRA